MALPAWSTVPALKAALYDALAARPALAGVQITYGAPLPDPKREFVWLQDVEGEQEASALGHLLRREAMTMTVIVNVMREDRNQQAATERAFAIAAEIEALLRENPALTGYYTGAGQILAAQVTGPLTLEEQANDQRRAAQLTVSVGWQARL